MSDSRDSTDAAILSNGVGTIAKVPVQDFVRGVNTLDIVLPSDGGFIAYRSLMGQSCLVAVFDKSYPGKCVSMSPQDDGSYLTTWHLDGWNEGHADLGPQRQPATVPQIEAQRKSVARELSDSADPTSPTAQA